MPLRLATRGSPLALWQAHPGGRPAAGLGHRLDPGGGGDRRGPPHRRPPRAARGSGRLREGGAGGRGPRRGRRRRALGQGPALVGRAVRARPGAGGPARAGRCTRPAGRRGAGLPAHRIGGGHRLGPTPGAAGQPATRSHFHRAAGQPGHPTGQRWASARCRRGGGGQGRRRPAGVVARPTALAIEVLDPEVMVPQVGQGALAVECRVDDAAAREALGAIHDERVADRR